MFALLLETLMTDSAPAGELDTTAMRSSGNLSPGANNYVHRLLLTLNLSTAKSSNHKTIMAHCSAHLNNDMSPHDVQAGVWTSGP